MSEDYVLLWHRNEDYSARIELIPNPDQMSVRTFESDGVAVAGLGSQDLLSVTNLFLKDGWRFERMEIDGLSRNDEVRREAYTSVLVSDLLSEGTERVLNTLRHEISSVFIMSMTLRKEALDGGTDTVCLVRNGNIQTSAPDEVRVIVRGAPMGISFGYPPRRPWWKRRIR